MVVVGDAQPSDPSHASQARRGRRTHARRVPCIPSASLVRALRDPGSRPDPLGSAIQDGAREASRRRPGPRHRSASAGPVSRRGDPAQRVNAHGGGWGSTRRQSIGRQDDRRVCYRVGLRSPDTDRRSCPSVGSTAKSPREKPGAALAVELDTRQPKSVCSRRVRRLLKAIHSSS